VQLVDGGVTGGRGLGATQLWLTRAPPSEAKGSGDEQPLEGCWPAANRIHARARQRGERSEPVQVDVVVGGGGVVGGGVVGVVEPPPG
jgi:hypothetical protein